MVAHTLRQHGSDEALRAQVERTRAALAELGPARSLERYPPLWESWFAVTPLADHGEVAQTVRATLEEIEALELADRVLAEGGGSEESWQALLEGLRSGGAASGGRGRWRAVIGDQSQTSLTTTRRR